MLKRMLSGGIIAGAAAGLLAAALQLWLVQPVLLEAELYESGELVHFGVAGPHDHGHDQGEAATHDHAAGAPHDHAAPAAADHPGFDPGRDGLSVLFTLIAYAGWGLLLHAAMALAEEKGHRVSAREGLVWGLAGFLSVQLAPSLGLAPELPGMAAADIVARQIWWVGTVAATAVGLWLLAFGRGWGAWGLAILLIAGPHLVGAPHPGAFTGPTPPELAAEFAGRALGVGAVAWAVLGLVAATLRARDHVRDGAALPA